MADTIVFFPKYTALVGIASYYSDPFEVVPYKTVVSENFLAIVSGGGAATAQFEQSSDLITWTGVAGATNLVAATAVEVTMSSPERYIRMKINVTTVAGAVAVVWSKGVVREN
jgi:hypothetical protein